MGDIKLKKGTGILFIMAVLFISSLLYLRYWEQCIMKYLIKQLKSLNQNIQI